MTTGDVKYDYNPLTSGKERGILSGDTHTQAQLDHYANQNNPNNDAYWANQNNHANQCNSNNDEYWHSSEKED